MRNWMIKPSLLCNRHLLGEHFEIHKAVGNLKHTGKWVRALTDKGFLEPQNFSKRHDRLVKEMFKRGINHNSPLDVKGVEFPNGRVDVKLSLRDLKKRCKDCRRNLC
jgi:hypothetical protein